MDDDDALSIPAHVLRRIDEAFDEACRTVEESTSSTMATRPSKTPKSQADDMQGGFIVEDAEGFIVDEDVEMEHQVSKPQYIPFSAIPTGLQLLDLQPDDEEVLSVFRNAASGWGGRADDLAKETSVSRKDWRAVCAVLVDHGASEPGVTEQDPSSRAESVAGLDVEDVEDDGASDVYMGSDSSLSDLPSSDDEFDPASSSKAAANKPTKSTKSRKKARLVSPSDESTELSARQRTVSRQAFSLFFPSLEKDDAALDKTHLTANHIAAAAKTINEKLTLDEIKEMLEAFSTLNDKSMSLGDFERMMVATKLA